MATRQTVAVSSILASPVQLSVDIIAFYEEGSPGYYVAAACMMDDRGTKIEYGEGSKEAWLIGGTESADPNPTGLERAVKLCQRQIAKRKGNAWNAVQRIRQKYHLTFFQADPSGDGKAS